MGCFVHIFNVQNKSPAIVHSSHVREELTEDITKILKEGRFVWVKVLEILPDRVRLSMKEVNQYNGTEFNKKDSKASEAAANYANLQQHPDFGALTGIKIEHEEDEG